MKKPIVLCLLCLLSSSLMAQDLVVTAKGDSLNCKITKLKNNYLYFTFRHQEETRNTLLPLEQVQHYQYNFYDTPVVAESQLKNTADYPRFTFGIHGGLSYRTAKTSDNVPAALKTYMRGLKSGWGLGAHAAYYFSEEYGIGLNYNVHRSSNAINNVYVTLPDGSTKWGRLEDNINITFVGPTFNARVAGNNAKNNSGLTASAGLGYLGYTNKAVLVDKFTIKGSTLGISYGIGYDLGLSEKTALEFRLNIIAGSLTSIEISEGVRTEKRKLEKENLENLSRLDLTIGLKFNR